MARARARAALWRACPAAERMAKLLAPLMCMCRNEGSCDCSSLGPNCMASWKLELHAQVPWRLTIQPALRKGGSSMKPQQSVSVP